MDLNFNSATNISGVFNKCYNLRNIKSISNIKINNLNFSTCYSLTHETLIKILNALYDYSTSEDTYTLALGSANLAKLTDEEIAIATNKGWNVSQYHRRDKYEIQEKQVILRKLVASEGKILVSKTFDDDGNPTVRSKEIYLANGASENDFEEIDE